MAQVSDKLGGERDEPVMQGFRYQHGDRPLEGYTIRHAIGRGGFGEVYYAVSDSGRQVALKAIQGYEHVELRGVRQCMNLKSPHLVTVFDVRHNAGGRPFVIMEHVSGPSLRALLDEAPRGLGPPKAAFFLREIAKGLTFLHDAGIVHRDLKPGNIFYENGYVKIGDYGLSKAISPSRCSGQTVTVGTVHYMAPEIGRGRYDRSIDLYALGAILYEMLAGHPPFEGASVGEILMKHLSAEPDLAGIDEPFAGVVRRALAKDPSKRCGSAQEMVEAVFGAEHVRAGVSHFAPVSLTLAAGKAAEAVAQGPPPAPATPAAPVPPAAPLPPAAPPAPDQAKTPQNPSQDAELNDTLSRGQRRRLCLIAIAIMGIGTGLLGEGHGWLGDPLSRIALCLVMIAGGTFGVGIARRRLNLGGESEPLWRLGFGGLASILCVLPAVFLMRGADLGADAFPGMARQEFYGSLGAVCLGLFLLNWRKMTSPQRSHRVVLGQAVLAGLLGLLLATVLGGVLAVAAGVLAGMALAAQVASPQLGKSRPGQVQRPRPPAKPAGHRVPPPPRPIAASPRKRLWAALLCFGWFLGLGGLHRFYVGKVGTGLLWLLTGGLCGIGQLVDLVLILVGDFTDAAGRPLLFWDRLDELARRPAAGGVSAGRAAPQGRLGLVLSTVGIGLMFIGVLIGLAAAANLPAILAADLPRAGIAGEMTALFGYGGWPALVTKIGMAAMMLVMLLAAVVLIIARRRSGFGPMFRAAVGAFGLVLAVMALREALARIAWTDIAVLVHAQRTGPAIELFFQQMQEPPAILAAVLLLASVIVLCWTGRQAAPAGPAPAGQGA